MNAALIFCEILAAWTITGAVEYSPGWVQVDYIDQYETPDFIIIPREVYEDCV